MNIICHSFCRDLRGFIVAVFDRFCFAPSLTRNELRPSAFTSEMTRFFNGWPSMQAWKSRIGPDSRYGLRFWDDEYFNLTGVHHLVGVFYFPIPFFLVISTDNHPVGVEKWYLPPGILVCGVFTKCGGNPQGQLQAVGIRWPEWFFGEQTFEMPPGTETQPVCRAGGKFGQVQILDTKLTKYPMVEVKSTSWLSQAENCLGAYWIRPCPRGACAPAWFGPSSGGFALQVERTSVHPATPTIAALWDAEWGVWTNVEVGFPVKTSKNMRASSEWWFQHKIFWGSLFFQTNRFLMLQQMQRWIWWLSPCQHWSGRRIEDHFYEPQLQWCSKARPPFCPFHPWLDNLEDSHQCASAGLFECRILRPGWWSGEVSSWVRGKHRFVQKCCTPKSTHSLLSNWMVASSFSVTPILMYRTYPLYFHGRIPGCRHPWHPWGQDDVRPVLDQADRLDQSFASWAKMWPVVWHYGRVDPHISNWIIRMGSNRGWWSTHYQSDIPYWNGNVTPHF